MTMKPTASAWRFNEAEAFTPRIPKRVTFTEITKSASFNEAEAFTPRIPWRRPSPANADARLQ